MRILKNLMKVFLGIIILYFLSYSYCVYKDIILSINSKKNLRGKIVYSTKGQHIKIIELPFGKNKIIYSIPPEINVHYGFVHSPYFSPDASMIVFSQSNDLFDDKLYIMDSDGLNVKLLLDLGDAGALCPSWSPDGKTIAYVVETDEKQGLYTIRVADRLITRISEIQPLGSQPSWSPDSKKIIFNSKYIQKKYLENSVYEVTNLGGAYLIDIDTKKIERYFDWASEPAWSPNGSMLTYSDKDGYYIINLEDSSTRTSNYIFIPRLKIPFMIGGTAPIRWSPDGKYIVFCKEIWPGIAGIYVTPIDNPKKQIRIGTDHQAIIGMSWGVDAVRK